MAHPPLRVGARRPATLTTAEAERLCRPGDAAVWEEFTPVERVRHLFHVFAYMLHSGDPDLDRWTDEAFPDDLEAFESFIREGQLFAVVENLKRACLRGGVPLSDKLLGFLAAGRVRVGEPLSAADRARIAPLIDELLSHMARLDAAAPAPPPNHLRADGGGGGSPHHRLQALKQWAGRSLSGQGRVVVEALCDAGGEVPIADLAVLDRVGWDDPLDGFKNLRKRVNPKIASRGWTLYRHDNAAHLEQLPSKPETEA